MSRTEKTTVYAVFDIRSASVGACIAHIGTKGATILWHTKSEYAFGPTQAYNTYTKKMYRALLAVGTELLQNGIRIAQEQVSFKSSHLSIVCVFDAPWYKSTVTSYTKREEKPFSVDHAFFDAVRSDMVTSFLNDPDTKAWRVLMGEADILEQVDTDIRYDGYRLLKEHVRSHETVREVHLSTYHALLSHTVLEQVRAILAKLFSNHTPMWYSLPRFLTPFLEAYTKIREERTACMVPTEYFTHAFVFDKGVLLGTSYVPFGTYHVMQACAPKAESPHEARSATVLALRDLASDEAPPKSVVRTLDAWREAYLASLSESTHGLLPRSVVCVTGSFWYQVFHTAFSAQKEGDTHMTPYRLSSGEGCSGNTPNGLAKIHDTRMCFLIQALACIGRGGV